MKGFDPRFYDLPSYILGITKEIWEDRGIAALRRYYGHELVVRAPDSVVVGNEGVIAATMATLAEFPDRMLLGEDVIWIGNEDEGFLSSHRILSTATHGGDGAFGPATGRRQRYADSLSRLMAADMASIRSAYDRAVQLELPGGVTGHGWEAADDFWMRLRNAFPSAEFRIHHRIGREDPLMPPRAALRWSLWGRHDGPGAFGPPTGAQVFVLGISHAEFGPYGLRREWVLYDETAIWKQIALHTG